MKAKAHRCVSCLVFASALALALSACGQFTLYDKFRSIEEPHAATGTLAIIPASALINAGATITFSASGGSTPYQYSVESGGGTVVATSGVYTAPNAAGVTTVKVTDATGDSATAQVTISTAAGGALTIYPASVSIASGTSLSFSVSGGTPPYTYAVTAGSGTVSSTGVYQATQTAGSATVTVTDSAHNTSSANIQIVLAGGFAINPASATITAGTTLTFTVANGTSPYSYSIVSGGGTIGAATGLYTAPAVAGTAKIRVTDGTSATSDATVTIVPPPLVMSPAAPTVTAGGVIDFVASGGTTPYTYTVGSGGAGGMITSTTGVYTAPTLPGTDTVTVTDASGKTSSATVTVVAASQVVIVPATLTLAAGSVYQFGASGGVPPYTYSLYSGAGSITTGGTYTAPGTASTDTVRVSDSAGSTSDAVVTVTPPPLIITPLTTSVIAGGNVTFSASGGTGSYTYSVLSGGAGGSILPSGVYTAPGLPGTDTVQVKDSSGTTSDAAVTIVSASQLLISPTTVTVGAGQTYLFGATGGTSPYTFSLLSGAGAVNATTGLYTAPASASTDTVRVTDAGGATSDATVTVTPPVAALAINPTAASVNVGGSLSFSASGGVSPYTYSVVGGTAGGTINPSTGSYTAPLAAGSYTVKVTDSTGATSSATVTVNAVPALSISPATLSLSAGATYQFGATGGVAPYTYSMYSGSGTVSSSGLYAAPSAASTDTVRVTDAIGTTSDATVTVAAPVPPLAISPAASSVTVDGQITFNVSGGTPPYSYAVLAGGAGGNIDGGGLYTAPSSTGTDTVQVADSLNRTADATVTVNPPPPLAITPTTLSIVANTTYQFGVSGGVPPYTYSIYSGTGTINSSTGLYTAPATASSATVRVTDEIGTTSDAAVTIVPTLAISPASTSVLTGGTVNFTATGGIGTYTYSVLAGGAGGTINSSSGVYTAPTSTGTDTVRVTDSGGTTSDATVEILAGSQLLISPASLTISVNNTYQFGVSGGTPPYTFSIFSGSGAVTSSGLYTAPASPSSDIVRVVDSAGTTSDATVTVVSGGPLAISPTTAMVAEGGTITFAGSGGTPPYIFTITSGSGSIGAYSGTYSATGSVGANAATISMSDNAGGSKSATVDIVPAAPTNLIATPKSNHSAIDLEWTNNTGDPNATIVIERSTDSGVTYTQLTPSPALTPGATTFSDTNVTPPNLYVYRVKAIDGTLSSAYSNIAAAVP